MNCSIGRLPDYSNQPCMMGRSDMTKSDRDLGMNRSISRRDFINGVSVAVGGTLVMPASIAAEEAAQQQRTPPAAASDNYPPALTGMRGSGDGMMDVGHALRDGKTWDAA